MYLSLISGCFISSDYGCLKNDGQLFEKALSGFGGVDRSRVLHIGDNRTADIKGAEAAGIDALFYGVISEMNDYCYKTESEHYGINLGELRSLRKISGATVATVSVLASVTATAAATAAAAEQKELSFFPSFGAEIIGPVYSVFAEWVLERAREIGASVILPFMREGELLAEVIRAADLEGKYYCEPVFVSRRAAFVASIFADNYKERIGQALIRGNRSLGSFFEELGIGAADLPRGAGFAGVANLPVNSLPRSDIEACLMNDEVKSKVIAYSQSQRELLKKYLLGFTKGQPALTVDIGTKGTVESYLHEIHKRDRSFPSFHSVIMLGASTNASNISKGVKIAAWAGIDDDCAEAVGKLQYQIQVLETLVSSTCGALLRYEPDCGCGTDGDCGTDGGCGIDGGAVSPILSAMTVSESQKIKVGLIKEGVLAFQRSFIRLKSEKPAIFERLPGKKLDLINILLRFIEFPTNEEAANIGELTYLDEHNFDVPKKLVGDKCCGDAKYCGGLDEDSVNRFIISQLKAQNYWPQASIPQRIFGENTNDPLVRSVTRVRDEVIAKGLKCGVIYAAGDLGAKVQRLACELRLPVACFADSNIGLHGTEIGGLQVRALSDIPVETDFIVVASYIYASEITLLIAEHYKDKDTKPEIYEL